MKKIFLGAVVFATLIGSANAQTPPIFPYTQDPTTGAVTWRVPVTFPNGATYSGPFITPGATTAFSPTSNFVAPASSASAAILAVLGSAGSANGTNDPIAIFEKYMSSTVPGASPNATVAVLAKRLSIAPGSHNTALYVENNDNAGAIDNTIANATFSEGLKAVSTVNAAFGSAQALITVSGSASGIAYHNLTGHESEVNNQSGVDAPAVFDPTHFAVAMLGSSGSGDANGKKADAAFMVNPFLGPAAVNASAFRRGFYCPAGSGGITTPVTDSCFASDAAVSVGIDLSLGTQSFASMKFPNAGVMRWRNGANSADLNTAYVDGSNQFVLGTDTANLFIVPPIVFNGVLKFAASTTGAVTPAFTNAPTGCTTVQWIGPYQVTAPSLTNVYIPTCHS